ncbi:MAG: aminotransferase class I/II-fold pyridoxal phosphate-dependent enzyme [Deltaproteobacteria bacterium]|nr:aminotransferase class I/II-fold pyridoxal phosphate-dependent enzyme [Deltaproteobacteria bacterium]
MPKLTPYMLERLQARTLRGERRSLKVSSDCADFASSDYLGYARSKLLKERILSAAASLPCIGSTGSRLLTGNSPLAEETEERVARCFGFPRALIFSSGFALNTGFLPAIAGEKDTFLLDENIHASLKTGLKLSKAAGYFFRHNDLNHLERRLKRLSSSPGNLFVVVESLYSMDGDITPLKAMADLCEPFGARLVVDEAHAAATIGQGHGLVAEYNLQDRVFASIVTFGKAFGCHGAALLGQTDLMDFVVNFCHSFVYTTAPSSFFFLAIREALSLFSEDRGEFSLLKKNISMMNQCLHEKAQDGCLMSPIRSIPFPAKELRTVVLKLQEKGFEALPIFSPTVKRGTERLRVCIHAFNAEDEIRQFANLIKEIQTDASSALHYRNSHGGGENHFRSMHCQIT